MPLFPSFHSEQYGPTHEGQTLELFYPGSKPPVGGFPVLVLPSLATFNTSTPLTLLRPDMPNALSRIAYRWVSEGIGAVVTATVTVSRGGATGNNVSDASYDPGSGAYGPAYDGNGLYVPPGHVSGAWENPNRPMPQKDIWLIRDWIRRNAAARRLNNGRVVFVGGSASAVIGALAIYGPDQRVALGLDAAHPGELAWAACHLAQIPTRLRTMDQTALGWMFPSASAPGANYDQPAATLDDTDPEWQDALSLLSFDTGSSVPMYLASSAASEGASLVPPYDDDLITDFHSLDFCAMAKLARPVRRLVSYADDVVLTGYEDAVYDDTANDDDSEYVIDIVSQFASLLNAGAQAMPGYQFASPVTMGFNKATIYNDLSLSDADWTLIVPAGDHKWIEVQNIEPTGTASAIRVALADADGNLTATAADGDPTGVLGYFLGPMPTGTAVLGAINFLSIPTCGQAVYMKSHLASNLADYYAVVYE